MAVEKSTFHVKHIAKLCVAAFLCFYVALRLLRLCVVFLRGFAPLAVMGDRRRVVEREAQEDSACKENGVGSEGKGEKRRLAARCI